MYRFFHECFSDPTLGTVIAVALILALAMAWFVFLDRLKKRQKHQRRERRRGEVKGKADEAKSSTEVPR
jgi:membrane protein implicated in regulation of membrane protease activity